ncbi:MAG: hypothetical protein H7263_06585, partial [Candidatus Sericytochromatia bacterium]|nr:hypothetical protein [Candidatus Sericytochromatia bacterium]
ELMVVIVIIGILVAIALPNFIAAQDRAKVASVKSNMHTLQTGAETYAVDNAGVYADSLTGTPGATANILVTEAKNKKYWKDFKNPFSGTIGGSSTGAYADLGQLTSALPASTVLTSVVAAGGTGTAGALNTGFTAYGNPTNTTAGNRTSYAVYGTSKDTTTTGVGVPVTEKGTLLFALSNS